jgi:acetylornithine deacetylase/succinyl-diaminopimelate desuccinylase family protein
MSMEKRLIDEIERHRNDIIKYTRDMVRIPSENPPGDETEVSDYISELLTSLGFDVEQVEPKPNRVNTLGVLKGTGGGKTLLWNGHYDTVPVGNLDYWTVDPFDSEVKGGRIYGRGSGDMKGAISSAIVAVKALGNLSLRFRGDLHLHAVADEEFFGRYGTKYLCENGYVKGVDAAIVGEASTRDSVVMARPAVRGRTLVNIQVKGRAAHSSRPDMGVNAVLKMSKVLLAIDETKFSFPKHELLPDPTIAPGTTIKGGTKDNIIPEDCEAVCDVRTVPGIDPEQVLQDIRAVVERLKSSDPELDVYVESPLNKPPSEISLDHPLYRTAAKATEQVVGYRLEPLGASGSNDTSYLTNLACVPTMALGPGGGNAHAPDEWVDVETLVTFAKIYGLMMLDICSYEM